MGIPVQHTAMQCTALLCSLELGWLGTPAGPTGQAQSLPGILAGSAWRPAGDDVDSIRLSWVRGHQLMGVHTEEWCLPLGTEVTVVGELTCAEGGEGGEAQVRRCCLCGTMLVCTLLGIPAGLSQPAVLVQGGVHALRCLVTAAAGHLHCLPPCLLQAQGRAPSSSGSGGCVLRAPKQGGLFLITRQPVPELISSLQADAKASRRLGWGLAALAVCLLAAAAVAGPLAGHSSGGGSGGGREAGKERGANGCRGAEADAQHLGARAGAGDRSGAQQRGVSLGRLLPCLACISPSQYAS